MVALVQKCCGGPESGVVYTEDRGKKCCGNHHVPMSSLCCQSNTGSWKVSLPCPSAAFALERQ